LSSFRFVHTADIHLDSPLKGLAGYDGAVAERIRAAGRESFDALVSLALSEGAAFVVIAGDLYDGDWRDYQTGLFFAAQMARLDKAGVQVFVVHGNHDAESQISRRLSLPGNVRTFSARKPETFLLKDIRAALHGWSFAQRDVAENLAAGYPHPTDGFFNIGVLHTGLGGLGGHANYAPCTPEDLVNKGYDYWALGHVHKREVLRERPHVVFPGNIQGRHIRESGAKGAYLVSVEHGEAVGLEFLPTDVVRWAMIPVAADGCRRAADAVDLMRQAIVEAVESRAEGRLLACRIEIGGRTEAHAGLMASADMLLAEARAAAASLGENVAWIEKVTAATEPVPGAGAVESREDALGALQRMLGDAAEDAELLQRLEADIGQLVRKLPHDARELAAGEDEDPILRAAVGGDYAALLRCAGAYLTARLTADGRGD
jgi:DNA repair protein SbcD/Mre11